MYEKIAFIMYQALIPLSIKQISIASGFTVIQVANAINKFGYNVIRSKRVSNHKLYSLDQVSIDSIKRRSLNVRT